MTGRRRWFVAGLALLSLAAISNAPSALAQDQSIPISDISSDAYPNVVVEFSVPPDLNGTELLPEEVAVEENGEPRQFSLRRTTAENIQVVVAIDTSGSMVGAPIDQAKVAAAAFVERLPADSQVALIGFGNEPDVLSEFTNDQTAVLASIAEIQVDPSAETSLYDATRLAIQLFPPATTGPRYVMVVTDGGDTISEASLGTAQSAVQAAGIPVFAVSLVTSESDPVALAAITAETGGGVVESTDPVALAGLTEQVASAITAQYEITYSSAANGRANLEIRIERNDQTATGQIGFDLPLLIQATPIPTTEPTPTPTAPPIPPGPAPSVLVGGRNLSWLLPAGIASVGLSLVGLFSFILWPTRRRRNPLRDMAPVVGSAARSSGGVLARASKRLVHTAEKVVAGRDGEGRLALKIDRAGIRMRPAEYIVLLLLIATVAFFLGLLANIGVGLMLLIVVIGGGWLVLGIKGDRRTAKFEEQLPTSLRMMGGGLRAGFSLSQVVELVATEAASPTCDEFARLSVEENLGRDIAESFRDVARRMESDDFKWVAEAVDINRAVGGDLSEVLENVSETIRTRYRIKGQIKTLSAEGRLSASILLAVPFLIFFGQLITSPELPRELVGSPQGRVAIVVGLVLMAFASVWMRRIVRLKY